MIVIFSSLLNCWYSFSYFPAMSLMQMRRLFQASTVRKCVVVAWKGAVSSRAQFRSFISLSPTPAFSVNILKDSLWVQRPERYFMSSQTSQSAPFCEAVVNKTPAYLPSIVSSLEGALLSGVEATRLTSPREKGAKRAASRLSS